MRTIKTSLAVALCAFVYYFFDRSPAFACIGAIFGLGYDMADSKLNGGNRLFGTIIGGVIGMAMYRINLIFYPDGRHSLLLVPLAAIGTGLFSMEWFPTGRGALAFVPRRAWLPLRDASVPRRAWLPCVRGAGRADRP